MVENRIAQNFGAWGLLKYALATVCMMLFTSIYTMVDGVFVAQFVSVDALSALNIVNPLFSLVMGFGVMLGAGGSAVIAKNVGEGEEQQAFDNLSTLVFFGTILGLVLMVLLLVFMEPILSLLGATEILMPYCKEYCYYIVGFLAPWVLELMFSSYFITAGKPQIGLIATLCSGVFNIVGDYPVLIVVVGMGIRGAALATGLATCIPVVIALIYFFNKEHSLHFGRIMNRPRMILKSCTNGVSEMISNLAAMVITLSYNLIMLRLAGEAGVAAITVILYLEFLFTAGLYGFASRIAPIISYNFGAAESCATASSGARCLCAHRGCVGHSLCGLHVRQRILGRDLRCAREPNCSLWQAGVCWIFATGFFVTQDSSLMTSNMFTALSEWWHFRAHLYTAQLCVRAHLLHLVLNVVGHNGRMVSQCLLLKCSRLMRSWYLHRSFLQALLLAAQNNA